MVERAARLARRVGEVPDGGRNAGLVGHIHAYGTEARVCHQSHLH